jgi:DNA invertase Pin-like site-specific DNA recombinase
MAQSVIPYYRVSTKKQGESGLGLESQQATVEAYAKQNGSTIIGTYTEVESGRRSDRPQLDKAIAHAKRSKAMLCVAKLDRLSRNVAFLSRLMESKVPFVACDNPHANKLTLHILVAMAEHEAEMISKRTKDALAAYKARGGKLGGDLEQCRNLTQAARVKGAQRSGEVVSRKADEAYSDLFPVLVEMKANGLSLRDMAGKLNQDGHTTRRGHPWNPVQVSRVLERASN